MLQNFLLNRCGDINYAKILFIAKNFRKLYLLLKSLKNFMKISLTSIILAVVQKNSNTETENPVT